jgi:hypothetical protein
MKAKVVALAILAVLIVAGGVYAGGSKDSGGLTIKNDYIF